MEIKYISKIDSYQPYLKKIFTNFSYISSYYQYRIPNIEEYNLYKDKISEIVIKKIWDQYLIDQKKKIKSIERKGTGVDKNFLDSQDLLIPHLKSSELLLIQTCINNDYDYKGIISVNMGHIPYGNKTEYYDINYVTKKHKNKYIMDGYLY